MFGCLSWLTTDISRRNRSIAGAGRGGLGDDQLQRDEPAGRDVLGLVDDPHGAPAELADDRVVGDGVGRGDGLTAAEVAEPGRSPIARPGRVRPRRGRDPAAGAADRGLARVHEDRGSRPRRRLDQPRPLDPDGEDALPGRDPVACPQPDPVDPLVVDERPVGAPQVAQLAPRGHHLDQEVVARQRRVLRHRAMDRPRPPHDERVVAIEDERPPPCGARAPHPRSLASSRPGGPCGGLERSL